MKHKLALSSIIALVLTLALAFPALAHDGVGGDELAASDSMLIVAVLFVLMTGIGILMSWNNGEFKNPEAIKRMMLEMALTDDDGDDLDKYALTEA